MSIFDLGRPTGAMAGNVGSETTRRSQRDSDLAHAAKREEFMDYLLDADLRSEVRKTKTAQAKSIQEVLPSQTDAAISGYEQELDDDTTTKAQNVETRETAETGRQQTIASRELIEPQKRQALAGIHTAMTEQEYTHFTRGYGAISEAIQQGMDPQQAYEQGYNELVRTAPNPQAAQAALESMGVKAEYSKESLSALMGAANWAMHDGKTVRTEHLLEAEYGLKIKQEQAKHSMDPSKVRVATEDDRKSAGRILSKSIIGFADLQGGVDDAGMYTDSKGSLVDTITNWSYEASANFGSKTGEFYAAPTEFQLIAADIMNYTKGAAVEDGIMWGWTHGGDTFDPLALARPMHAATSILQVRKTAGDPRSLSVMWQEMGPGIMASLARTDAAVSAQTTTLPDKPLPREAAAPTKKSIVKNPTKKSKGSSVNIYDNPYEGFSNSQDR